MTVHDLTWMIPVIAAAMLAVWMHGKIRYEKGRSDGWIDGFHLRADTEIQKAVMMSELKFEIERAIREGKGAELKVEIMAGGDDVER